MGLNEQIDFIRRALAFKPKSWCPACRGTGMVKILIPADNGNGWQSLGRKPCDTCHGVGYVAKNVDNEGE